LINHNYRDLIDIANEIGTNKVFGLSANLIDQIEHEGVKRFLHVGNLESYSKHIQYFEKVGDKILGSSDKKY
jgi:hypothetical protein